MTEAEDAKITAILNTIAELLAMVEPDDPIAPNERFRRAAEEMANHMARLGFEADEVCAKIKYLGERVAALWNEAHSRAPGHA